MTCSCLYHIKLRYNGKNVSYFREIFPMKDCYKQVVHFER